MTDTIMGLGPPVGVRRNSTLATNGINIYSTPGSFRFRVNHGLLNTHIRRKLPIRWEAVNRIGRAPAMQFMGAGEETVSIPGFLYPEDFGGWDMLNRMRDEATQGIPRPFASASGIYHGIWCIKEISDEQEYFLPNGNPRKVTFTIELSAYGPDGASGFSIYI
ncbi:phage tail protein [Hyphomicrobium sp.]|uniref:phage tail protein n=1 Tax=Hyphomicrobium sp. TaxID=82 RepID=UPI001D3E365C|nr:phage tail protein [Hyphomicrobium sp.]MBY0559878.1 phage tail protein [Hyphomicrobium sp.]